MGREKSFSLFIGEIRWRRVLDLEVHEVLDLALAVSVLQRVAETTSLGAGFDGVLNRNDFDSAHNGTSLKYSSHTTRSIR